MQKKRKYLLVLASQLIIVGLAAQVSMGTIQHNTNTALPSSYDWKEYVFGEPDDQGNCDGTSNSSAQIAEVFMAQTHRHAIGHPLFFTIGHRPALLQVAVIGSGDAPDVWVEGKLNGSNIGELCLAGPSELSHNIDLSKPDFTNYFSVTLPKQWIQDGLELTIRTGEITRSLTQADLKVGPYTELNLVMVLMDALDYNEEPYETTAFEYFLPELASAIPASVVRFGVFPDTLRFPDLIASNNSEELVYLNSADQLGSNGIDDEGNINSVMSLVLGNMQQATGDFLSTIYFGNTMNLAPGGWGGGRNFVGFDYTDIFIHELGHALSLPHWEENFNIQVENEDMYLYPYGGETNDGGGRGEAWNFIQHHYEFVSPICEDTESSHTGKERSDCMQREFPCYEVRSNGIGPWDGFGDFSAMAIHRFLVGAEARPGQVSYRDEEANYQLGFQDGYPILSNQGGQRTYDRDPLQLQTTYPEDAVKLPGTELAEQKVYLIYGTTHGSQDQANILYDPIAYTGTLPPVIDPTDPVTFANLLNLEPDDSPILYQNTRDITLRLTYEDGSTSHALVPHSSFAREVASPGEYGIWREDVCNFAVVVPGELALCGVEMYHRPFFIGESDDTTLGNIKDIDQNITASNFMEGAQHKVSSSCTQTTANINLQDEHMEIFKVQPNPTSGSFVLTGTLNHYNLDILDATGTTISSLENLSEKQEIDLNALPAGLYFLRVIHHTRPSLQVEILVKQ